MKLRRPWAQNAALTAQTVREHIVDDPVQLALQISRRLPVQARSALGNGLAKITNRGGGVLETIGHAIAGDRERANQTLDDAVNVDVTDRRARASRRIAHLADVALSLGQPDRAQEMLASVPRAERKSVWFAVASRIALYRGDHGGAVEFASRHPRNESLAKRMFGEQQVFAGYVPELPAESSYIPRPGSVLHVLTNSAPHTSSGYAQRSHSILKSVQQLGHEVAAVTRPGYPVQVGVPWAAGEDVVEDIRYIRLLPATLGQGLKERVDQHARLLAEEVRKFRPAVLHTTTHFTNALAVGAVARAFGIPFVYEVRGQLADTWASTRGPEALESQRYREFQARELDAAKAADHVVTLGAMMKQRLIDGGVPEINISVCPNAVGVPFTDDPPGQADARARLGIQPDAQVVGTVSSIVDYEGLDLLVRAVAKLAPTNPKLRLHIAGDGVALPGLKVLAERLGIANICEFPGRVQRPEAIWHHAALDLFVVPRRDLSVTRSVTPMKSVEASAVGRPVVASNLPALQELVVDDETGLLFEAENVDALADALSSLLADPERRAKMGAAAREWVKDGRTWSANALTYEHVYRELTR
ncbi:MAG: glycosyltransferase family 4 protein [Gulosibacter sp.]|uniref:glycosyltransferase family 4 protein n=1 Tax=Gulosibacter sp. TaxID=2817531 RepID=UPI003F910384